MPTRVLIVEDNADINQIVATHLARCGFACTQAFSGSEARLLLTDPTRAFDVVLSDLMLPGSAAKSSSTLVRQRDAHVPIIVISARTAASDRVSLLGLGADDYLTKPFDLDELVARIQVQLRHRALRGREDDAANHGAQGGKATSGQVQDANPSAALRFRAWELDPDARTFAVDGLRLSSPASSSTSWRRSWSTPGASSPRRNSLSVRGASLTPPMTTR